MPTKTQSVCAPSTAIRMMNFYESVQNVIEGLAEDQMQTQQRVETVERSYKNMSRTVSSLHRRIEAAEVQARDHEARLDGHKRRLHATESVVREVCQKTDKIQTTLDPFLQQPHLGRTECADKAPGREFRKHLDFFNMTDEEKDKARADFRKWACGSWMRQVNLLKEKVQGVYGAYISYCAASGKFRVFCGNNCMYVFYRTFKVYEESVKYRNAVLQMLEIELIEDIASKDDSVKNFRIKTDLSKTPS